MTTVNVESENSNNKVTVSGLSKYYSDLAKNYAAEAQTAATNAQNCAGEAENAENSAHIWAEGTDAQVLSLDGEHSAKVWAQIAQENSISAASAANTELSNLSEDGMNLLEAQKAYLTGMNILSDEKGYNQLLELKNNGTQDKEIFQEGNISVVGSPDINDDGTASGFTVNDYLVIDTDTLSLTAEDNWKISMELAEGTGDQLSIYGDDNSLFMRVYRSGGLTVYTKTDWGSRTTSIFNEDYPLYATISNNAEDSKIYISDGSDTFSVIPYEYSKINHINIGVGSTAFSGTFNLNEFKVYKDDELIYSIQIGASMPYVLTATGSKIVDALYRDTVQEIYEKEGKALYYTIDEENKNYTIPIGETYGMITGIYKLLDGVEELLKEI